MRKTSEAAVPPTSRSYPGAGRVRSCWLMQPAEFAQKWKGSTAKERSASQENFIDLCHMLGHATPNSDPTGNYYAWPKARRHHRSSHLTAELINF